MHLFNTKTILHVCVFNIEKKMNRFSRPNIYTKSELGGLMQTEIN